jgi:hypothetical protein
VCRSATQAKSETKRGSTAPALAEAIKLIVTVEVCDARVAGLLSQQDAIRRL